MSRATEFLRRKGALTIRDTSILTMKRDGRTYNINAFLEEFHKEQTLRFKVKTYVHSKVQQLADYINRD